MKRFLMFGGAIREHQGGMDDAIAFEPTIEACLQHLHIARDIKGAPSLWIVRDPISKSHAHGSVWWWYIVDTQTWTVVMANSDDVDVAPKFTVYADDLEVAYLNDAFDAKLQAIHATPYSPEGNT